MNAAPDAHVGVAVTLHNSLGRRICRGIINYAKERGNWRLFDCSRGVNPARFPEGAQHRGLIMHLTGALPADVPPEIPVVSVGARNLSITLPRVVVDNRAVGRLVANHFLSRGFSSLAFLGYEHADFSHHRREGFTEVAEAAGVRPARLLLVPMGGWSPDSLGTMVSWLRELPKPVGLMVVQDFLALPLMRTVLDAGIRIPEEVAMVSVDSDDVLCEMADVPLSSVSPPFELQGYQAAMLLDRLMNGEPAPADPIFVSPGIVEMRASSDVLATADPVLRRAVSLIHSTTNPPLTVAAVANAVNASRRYLERHFRTVLGRTPHEEIARVRLDRARKLLLQTSLSLAEVAAEAGFREVKTMAAALRKEEGMTPGDFRQRHRKGAMGERPATAPTEVTPPVAARPAPSAPSAARQLVGSGVKPRPAPRRSAKRKPARKR